METQVIKSDDLVSFLGDNVEAFLVVGGGEFVEGELGVTDGVAAAAKGLDHFGAAAVVAIAEDAEFLAGEDVVEGRVAQAACAVFGPINVGGEQAVAEGDGEDLLVGAGGFLGVGPGGVAEVVSVLLG